MKAKEFLQHYNWTEESLKTNTNLTQVEVAIELYQKQYSMTTKTINLLAELAASSENGNDFETELRGKPDELGFFSVFVNYINPAFTSIILRNDCRLINVATVPTKKKLFVTLKFNTADESK